MYSSDPLIVRMPGLRSASLPEPAFYVLAMLGRHDLCTLNVSKCCFDTVSCSIDTERESVVLRHLFSLFGSGELGRGASYTVLFNEKVPAGIVHGRRLLWLLRSSIPDDVQARFEVIRTSSLDDFGLGEGLARFPGVYQPGRVLMQNLRLEGCRKLLDLGCGTGLLSIMAAKLGIECVATDINPICIANTKYNACAAGVDVRVVESDVFSGIPECDFDVIACFPPVCNHDSRGRSDDAETICNRNEVDPSGTMVDKILRGAGTHLSPDGTLQMLFCCASELPQDLAKYGLEEKGSKIIRAGEGYAAFHDYFMEYKRSSFP